MRIAVVSWMTITSIMRSMLMTVFARMLFIAWRSRRLLMLIKSAAYHLRWFDIQWIRIFVIAVVGVGCAWFECTIGFTYSDNVTHDFRFLFSSQLGLVYVCGCVCLCEATMDIHVDGSRGRKQKECDCFRRRTLDLLWFWGAWVLIGFICLLLLFIVCSSHVPNFCYIQYLRCVGSWMRETGRMRLNFTTNRDRTQIKYTLPNIVFDCFARNWEKKKSRLIQIYFIGEWKTWNRKTFSRLYCLWSSVNGAVCDHGSRMPPAVVD